jgi:hypothetical protein
MEKKEEGKKKTQKYIQSLKIQIFILKTGFKLSDWWIF